MSSMGVAMGEPMTLRENGAFNYSFVNLRVPYICRLLFTARHRLTYIVIHIAS